MKTNTLIFRHQQPVFEELLSSVELFLDPQYHTTPVRPRFSRLIIGPSGVGKSALVRLVAEAADLPLYEMAASNWMPAGAKDSSMPNTIKEIAEFCLQNEKGIIFLDEVDKLCGESAWMNHVRVEIFGFLDRKLPHGLSLAGGETEDQNHAVITRDILRKKAGRVLRNGMFIIGAGAFQSLWKKHNRSVCGFDPSAAKNERLLSRKHLYATLPEEIVNRFGGPVLQIPPLGVGDYQEILDSTISRFKTEGFHPDLIARIKSKGEMTLADAVSEQTGCRWIEEVVSEALKTFRREGEPLKPAINLPLDPDGDEEFEALLASLSSIEAA